MNGSKTLGDTLANNATITALLDSVNTKPMISSNPITPSTWGKEKSTINYALTLPINGSLEHYEYGYTVNCRASTAKKSQAIAEAVKGAVNRFYPTAFEYYTTTQITLEPSSPKDNYNTPIEVLIKSKTALD